MEYKIAAMRLNRTTMEDQESLEDGIIVINHKSVKVWYKCDCGVEKSYWNNEIKGKELSLLTDCGCGIWAKNQAEKVASDMAVIEANENRKTRLPGVKNRKTMRAFNIDLELLDQLEDYALAQKISVSQAVIRAVTIGLGQLKGEVK